MVLGIDEFLPVEKQNLNVEFVEFVEFKKFYQRIYKETWCKYKNCVDEIKSEYSLYVRKITKTGFCMMRLWYAKIVKNTIYIFLDTH